jgi:Trypsin-like peptidase domain
VENLTPDRSAVLPLAVSGVRVKSRLFWVFRDGLPSGRWGLERREALSETLCTMAFVRAQNRCHPLFQASRVAVGDGVFALGNPRGLEGSFSQGIVSGIRQIGDTTLFQITAPISPESSGGPIVEASGSVIEVAVATLQGGQNLNFAISISHIQDLLKTAGQSHPLSRVSKKKDETRKSILSEIGAPGIEKVMVSSVVCTDALYTWHCNFSVHNGLDVMIAKVRYLKLSQHLGYQRLQSLEDTIT